MKIHLLLALAFVYVSATAQQFNRTIYFENDESVLDESDKVVITELVNFLKNDDIEISSIEIYGFADTSASVNYNKTLSKKRCDVVYATLELEMPIALKDNIKMFWFGELKEGDAKKDLHYSQRCVDVFITYKEIKSEDNISELFDQLRTPTQKFKIDPTRDTIITGKAGTIISVDANSFYIPKSCEGEKMDIILLEAYDPAGMIMNNLVTSSGKNQLETDGMVFINAQMCNRILTIKEDKPITVMFPTTKPKEGMQLFTGKKLESGVIDWELSNDPLNPLYSFQVPNYLTRYNFRYKKYRKDCPYFFCGLRETLNMDNTKYREKRSYKAINWKAYHAYMDSACAALGVRSWSQFYAIMEKRAKAQAEMNYYVTATTNLGWMNCDRFLDLPENEKTNVMVQQKPDDNINAFLVFRDFKSILNTNYPTPKQIGFGQVGIGQRCYAVLLKYEDKIPYLSIKEITIEADLIIEPEFVKMTTQELQIALAKLNS